jgi:hypothetical protein
LENIRLENGKMETKEQTKPEGLALLRAPFPPNQISRLPKPTKAQTDEVRANFKSGVRCEICGGWHHPKVVHLDYVGHAALTDRLLDADPYWTWEPLAIGSDGLPVIDKDGGLWIRLTVCGVTRLGYGDAQGKTGGDAMKERIGDALRNAAMRFGAALDLWHKGDLHVATDDDDVDVGAKATTRQPNNENPNGLPIYTEAQLVKNLPAWQEAINSGRTTADKIVAKVSSGYRLTKALEGRIRSLEKQQEVDPFVADMVAAEQFEQESD